MGLKGAVLKDYMHWDRNVSKSLPILFYSIALRQTILQRKTAHSCSAENYIRFPFVSLLVMPKVLWFLLCNIS